MPRRGRRAAAEEDPDAVLEEVVRNLAVDRLVRVGDAAGRAGGDKFAAVDVAADGPAALQGGGEDASRIDEALAAAGRRVRGA